MIHSNERGSSLLVAVFLTGALASGCVAPETIWPEGVERGIVFAAWTPNGYGSPESFESLDQLARTGASHVAIVVTGYVDSLEDSTVEVHSNRTPTEESVSVALAEARRLGLETVLKPHVDVLGGAYRGEVRPANRELWMDSYESFLLPWAELAEREGCAAFSVGTELASMTPYENRWARLVDRVRSVYSGPLVYGASWTDLESPETRALFRLVDAAGVDAYFPVADEGSPSVADMLAAWQPWLELVEEVARETGRPIIITEVGCMSRYNAAVAPWVYDGSDAVDVELQARYYEAAICAFSGCDAIRGVYFWAWGISPAGPDDGTHSPRGKPAAVVLRQYWETR